MRPPTRSGLVAKTSLDPPPSKLCNVIVSKDRTNLWRSLLSLLVGASIMVLPIAGATAIDFKGGSTDEAAATSVMPTDDMECCPQTREPVRKHDDRTCAAICLFMCSHIAELASADIVFPSANTTVKLWTTTALSPPRPDSPPFRPPRT
jgi:hypothetical protein